MAVRTLEHASLNLSSQSARNQAKRRRPADAFSRVLPFRRVTNVILVSTGAAVLFPATAPSRGRLPVTIPSIRSFLNMPWHVPRRPNQRTKRPLRPGTGA
jgi:hypothetical protein